MSAGADAIVIGGGHNGLVAAAYLAKAGRRVVALERRPILGGATVTEELLPGFRVSACADGAPRLLPEIVRDLGLARHGLRIQRADPAVVMPLPDGGALPFWRDDDRTAAEIARLSTRDASAYPRFAALIRDLAGLVGAAMRLTPPDPLHPERGDALPLLRAAARARGLRRGRLHEALRVLPMSVGDLAAEWFESEPLRAAVAAAGVTGVTWGPSAAGTAYVLLHNAVGEGVFGPSGVVRGGMGALAEALADAARAHGAEIRTGAEVAEVAVADGRVEGVALTDGQVLRAPVVLSSADPRTTYLRLLDPGLLDPGFVHEVRRIKYRGSCARVHLALAGEPSLAGAETAAGLTGRIRVAPSVKYVERAYDDAKYGRPSAEPYIEATVPSLGDPTLAPEGYHLLSATVQFTPFDLADGGWDDRRERLADTVVQALSAHIPGLEGLVTDRRVITPADLEREYGLPEGNPHHGELSLDQLLYMRPVPGWSRYRAPVDGLYLCGAGAHPGGGVTGAPGANAAREALRDAASGRRRRALRALSERDRH